MERFIKNKVPLNLAHISHKKEKQIGSRTIRRIVITSQSNDDEEKETWLKR
jgi:hypothetical protein